MIAGAQTRSSMIVIRSVWACETERGLRDMICTYICTYIIRDQLVRMRLYHVCVEALEAQIVTRKFLRHHARSESR